MRPRQNEGRDPRPNHYSIICPVCGKPAAGLEYDPPVARYMHYTKLSAYWHGTILKGAEPCREEKESNESSRTE